MDRDASHKKLGVGTPPALFTRRYIVILKKLGEGTGMDGGSKTAKNNRPPPWQRKGALTMQSMAQHARIREQRRAVRVFNEMKTAVAFQLIPYIKRKKR